MNENLTLNQPLLAANQQTSPDIPIPAALARIQATIDFIEDNLHNSFGVRDLADVAQMSQWHFQRVFRAIVGETVKNYIRSRRLSRAATALLESGMNILEIALEAGFDSNEAFTRAFRSQFGLSPRAFRQQQRAVGFPQMKPQIGQSYLQHLHQNLSLTPEIVDTPELRLVGMKAEYAVEHAVFDLLELARPLWQSFLARLLEITGRVDQHVCLLCDIISSTERQIRIFVLIGAQVHAPDNLPADMITMQRPALKNAIFQHAGDGTAWEYTMHYIFGSWLAESGQTLAQAPAFCRFLPQHSPFGPGSQLQYYVALR